MFLAPYCKRKEQSVLEISMKDPVRDFREGPQHETELSKASFEQTWQLKWYTDWSQANLSPTVIPINIICTDIDYVGRLTGLI